MSGITRKYIIRDQFGILVLNSSHVRNWKDIKARIERDKIFRGTFRKFTNTFEFVGEARTRIRDLKEAEGVDAKMSLEIQIGNQSGHLSSFRTFAIFEADFSSYDMAENVVTINFIDTSFEEKIKARSDIAINLNTLESIDGETITPFSNGVNNAKINPRDILILTRFSTPNDETQILDETYSGPSHIPRIYNTFNMDVVYSNIPEMQPTTARSRNESFFPLSTAYIEGLFILNSTQDRLLTFDFTNMYLAARRTSAASDNFRIWTGFIKYQNGDNYDYVGSPDFVHISELINDVNVTHVMTEEVSWPTSVNYEIKEGESVGIGFFVDGIDTTAIFDLIFDGHIEITFIDKYPSTTANIIFPHEAFTRSLQIITGIEKPFYSNFFGRPNSENRTYPSYGEGSMLGLVNGKMLRNFPYDENPINVKFKELFESYANIYNLGAGIETVNGAPVLRIEHIEHFFLNEVLLTLNETNEVSNSFDSDLHFNSIKVGYKDYEYEEANGVDAFNGSFEFSLPISSFENKLEIESKYRADDGIEFARRKQRSEFPTDDTRYDKEIFLLSCQRSGPIFESKTWGNYDVIEGIFAGNTAYNLDITPQRNLRRWSKIFGSCLMLKEGKKIKYTKGANNAELITRKDTETNNVVEKGDILISYNSVSNPDGILEVPFLLPEKFKLESPISYDDWEKLFNFDEDTGIDNKNKLIKFFIRDNNKSIPVYGYIDMIDYDLNNGIASIELIRANR